MFFSATLRQYKKCIYAYAVNSRIIDTFTTAIVLPEQSVAAEKAGLAVNKKGLTLKDLLQQTSHHNAKVRRGMTFLVTYVVIILRVAIWYEEMMYKFTQVKLRRICFVLLSKLCYHTKSTAKNFS